MDTLIAPTYVSVLKIYFETAFLAEAATININRNDLLFSHFLCIFVSSVL